MDQLTLSMTPDGEGVWGVHADLQTETFCGKGWAWGAPQDLLDFASQLMAYPITAEAPAKLRPFGDSSRLSVEVRPLGQLGTLEARVVVTDPDDPTRLLRAKFMTGYASVARLVPQLWSLAAGRADAAVLVSG